MLNDLAKVMLKDFVILFRILHTGSKYDDWCKPSFKTKKLLNYGKEKMDVQRNVV